MPRIRPQVSLVLDKDDTKGITTPGIVEGYEWQSDAKTRKRYQTLVAYSAGTVARLKNPPEVGFITVNGVYADGVLTYTGGTINMPTIIDGNSITADVPAMRATAPLEIGQSITFDINSAQIESIIVCADAESADLIAQGNFGAAVSQEINATVDDGVYVWNGRSPIAHYANIHADTYSVKLTRTDATHMSIVLSQGGAVVHSASDILLSFDVTPTARVWLLAEVQSPENTMTVGVTSAMAVQS